MPFIRSKRATKVAVRLDASRHMLYAALSLASILLIANAWLVSHIT